MLIGSYGLSSRFVAALDAGGDPIVSRGAFPKRVEAAVRQKARWTTGISLEGWDHLGCWLRQAPAAAPGFRGGCCGAAGARRLRRSSTLPLSPARSATATAETQYI